MSKILELKDINKTYRGKTENLQVLKDLNLNVEEGEFISILGKSGSGKSTLLSIMGLLDEYDSGDIYINNKKINKLKFKEMDKLKNQEIGFVFQFNYLLPEFTALENVMIPSLINNFKEKFKIEKKAKDILDKVGLSDRYNHKPSELSGGEKQRVAIARALINNPKILLADEPTGNLDGETSEEIHKLLKKINKEKKQTIIVVTHSKELASITDKQYHVKQGKLILEN